MVVPPKARAGAWVNPCDAVFTPSGGIVRLRRGNKHAQLLAAALASSGAFVCSEAAAVDLVLLRGIVEGRIEVM